MTEKKAEICVGDCLFCNSKCPECSSTKIAVRYSPVFEFENDTENCINIHMADTRLKLECRNCGRSFDDELDSALDPLTDALRETLGLPLYTLHESVPLPDGDHLNITEYYILK